MTNITRRGFIALLAGAIAGAKAGITQPEAGTFTATLTGFMPQQAQQSLLVNARHIYALDLFSPKAPCFIHRIDVLIENQQWGVDLCTPTQELPPKALEPALHRLNNAIEHEFERPLKVGQIFTFSQEEWASNQEAQNKWGKIGAMGPGL